MVDAQRLCVYKILLHCCFLFGWFVGWCSFCSCCFLFLFLFFCFAFAFVPETVWETDRNWLTECKQRSLTNETKQKVLEVTVLAIVVLLKEVTESLCHCIARVIKRKYWDPWSRTHL